MLPLVFPTIMVYTFSYNIFFQVLPLIIVILVIAYLAQPTHIDINDDSIRISGLYGKKYKFTQIKSVQLSDSISRILLRTNGLGLGPVKIGFFRLQDIGRCRLFLNGNYTPYLIIETWEMEIIILNNKNKEYIYHIYSTINKNIH